MKQEDLAKASGVSPTGIVNIAILTRIDDTVAKIDARLDDTAAKPAQRWDALVTQVIGLVVAALVGMAMMQAGIGRHRVGAGGVHAGRAPPPAW